MVRLIISLANVGYVLTLHQALCPTLCYVTSLNPYNSPAAGERDVLLLSPFYKENPWNLFSFLEEDKKSRFLLQDKVNLCCTYWPTLSVLGAWVPAQWLSICVCVDVIMLQPQSNQAGPLLVMMFASLALPNCIMPLNTLPVVKVGCTK